MINMSKLRMRELVVFPLKNTTKDVSSTAASLKYQKKFARLRVTMTFNAKDIPFEMPMVKCSVDLPLHDLSVHITGIPSLEGTDLWTQQRLVKLLMMVASLNKMVNYLYLVAFY